jgi:hypothetical protein
LEVSIATWLDLEASAVVRVLLRHDRFVFEWSSPGGEPPSIVHEVPPASFGLGAGLAARAY